MNEIFDSRIDRARIQFKRCDIKIILNINIISHPINNQVVLFCET